MDHIFKDMVNIREAQIHQARPGKITIRVVPGRAYAHEDELALLRETVKRVGQETDVSIDYVDSLPRSNVGKLRFVVCDVPGASIENPHHALRDDTEPDTAPSEPRCRGVARQRL
jgi:phenylacetate-CoA ligase